MKISFKISNLSLFACLLAGSLFLFSSCEQKIKELTEGTVLEIDSDLLFSPIIVQFKDATDGSIPNNITIELVGKDAASLYSMSGKSTVRPIDGLMDLGFEKSIDVSETNPFEFSIVAKATGYLPTIQAVVLTDVEPREIVIQMVKLDNAPNGVSVTNHSFSVGNNGTTEALSFEIVTGNANNSTIQIAPGTKLLDTAGNELTGQVNFQIVNFDHAAVESQNFYPQSNMAILENGSKEYGAFLGLSSVALDMRVGNVEVKSFSIPLSFSTTIPSNATDGETNQPIQNGYNIPAWSLDETTGTWRLEANEAVETSANNELVITTPIPHLSFWRFAVFFPSIFGASSAITIDSDIPNSSDLSYKYYSELETKFFGFTFRNSVWSNTTRTFRDGEVIQKPYAVFGNLPATLKVYAGNRFCKGDLLATSSPFRFSDNPTVNLSSLFAVQPQITATFVANVLCPGITLKPTLYVLYRESNSPCPGYQLLGVMVNGEIQTSQLDLDTEYDFKSVWNEDIFTFDRRTVRTEATNYGLSIGLTEAQVVGILNGINDNQAKILIGLYEIMPTQSECTKLTGN